MLADNHLALLRASAISEEVADARGYFTAAGSKASVGNLGFGTAQRLPPALVIPQWDALGENTHHMLRPDTPRVNKRSGKPVKYETPAGATQIIDVPPMARVMLEDPAVPLIITEGSRKADAAVSRGMCAISLNGVYGWRGRNASGGTTALVDWELIALNGRPILLAFDDDAMAKKEVHEALRRFAGFLMKRHAKVRFILFPPDPSGAKVGLDDWLAADADRMFADLEALAVEELPELEPAEPVDTFDDVEDEPGWLLLDDVRDLLTKYVWFPDDGLADAVALWAVHTHLIDVLDITPRLHIRSPMKRSGKSRLLEVVALLVRRPMSASMTRGPTLFRSIAAFHPTLLIDELDQLLRADAGDDSGVIGVINLGYERSEASRIPRAVGTDNHVEMFETFAPVVMAGIGKTLPDTTTDRSITIRLERRPPDGRVATFRRREARADTRQLVRRISAWGFHHAEAIGVARPARPNGPNDRQQDIWEPLLAIADAAGGSWPERSRAVAVALAGQHETEDIDSTMELQLLVDIRETWPEHVHQRFSAEIVKALNMLDGRPWADLGRGAGVTTNWLARKLKDFGIHPTKVRIGVETRQGYYEDRFVGVWERHGVTLTDDQQVRPSVSVEPEQLERTEQTRSEDGPLTRDVPPVPCVPVAETETGEPVDASPNGDVPPIPGATKSFHKRAKR